MGVDPSVEDVMAHPPRKPTDRVVDGAMWSGVLLVGAVMAVSTLATLDIFLPDGLIETSLSTDSLLEQGKGRQKLWKCFLTHCLCRYGKRIAWFLNVNFFKI